jgi:hypothetical protein
MKILIVLTSHDKLGETSEKTGFWPEEGVQAPAHAVATPPAAGRTASEAVWPRRRKFAARRRPTIFYVKRNGALGDFTDGFKRKSNICAHFAKSAAPQW